MMDRSALSSTAHHTWVDGGPFRPTSTPGTLFATMRLWEGVVRAFLIAIMASASTSGAAAQQQPCTAPDNVFGRISTNMNPAIAAQRDFERAVCE